MGIVPYIGSTTCPVTCRFCSLEDVQPFIAEFAEPDAFARAAEARASHGEIILMAAMFSDNDARDMALNSLLMLQRLGFSHWLLLTQSEAWCRETDLVFHGRAGCIHFDFAQREPYRTLAQRMTNTARLTWMLRCVRLAARAGSRALRL